MRQGLEGSRRGCSTEKVTAVAMGLNPQTLEDSTEPTLKFPTQDGEDEVFIIQLPSVIG